MTGKTASDPIFAQVISPRAVRGLFTYSVPQTMASELEIGKRVVAPFGPKKIIGLVAGFSEQVDIKTRQITQIIDDEPVVSSDQIKLALWVADYYAAPPGDVIPLIMPRNDAKLVTVVELAGERPPSSRSKIANRIYETLRHKGGERKLHLLSADLEMTQAELKKILSGKLVKSFTRIRQAGRIVTQRNVETKEPAARVKVEPVRLTDDQRKAVASVAPDIEKGRFSTHLIYGVTGSGKTEVYAELARLALNKGKSVLVLTPEIALCDIITSRFEKRLGLRVTVLHSGMKPKERHMNWDRVRTGQSRLVVGARSAVFAPMPNLGLVIIDEEHDASYKQEDSPRYHGRDTAIKRCSMEGVPVVLGSATPSMESYHNALTGKYGLVELTHRTDGREMPEVEIVEPDSKKTVGQEMAEALRSRLEAKEQSLLFINKRGAARFVQCDRCGHVFECRNCTLSLVLHSSTKKLNCHTCGYSERAPDKCPQCGSGELFAGGAGTQKVEKEISELFPGARIARMDRDTTSRRSSSAAILEAVENRSVDVLVGTQMVTKGHDYPGITLVGVISADNMLHMPDFRAAERTFQQITQAAGRAGRGGGGRGLVVVQTLSGGHYSVSEAARHDFASFYKQEAQLRKLAGYPPFVRLSRIRIEASSVKNGQRFIECAEPIISRITSNTPGLTHLGPVEAVVFKVRNRYRWRILLKADRSGIMSAGVKKIVSELDTIPAPVRRKARVVVDVDPMETM